MEAHLSPAKHPSFLRAFKEHPESVGETYLEHMAFAGWFASRLLLAGSAALIHAILPAFFQTTASTQIRELHHLLENRNRTGDKG